jgi:hypothetical protein
MSDTREFKRYVDIDRSRDHYYSSLIKEKHSPFYKMNKRDVFIFAAAVGSYYNSRSELKDKVNLNLYSDFPEKYRILADIIALKEFKYDTDKILDGKEVVKLLEEFADGGIERLYDMTLNDLQRNELEEELFRIFENFKIKKN